MKVHDEGRPRWLPSDPAEPVDVASLPYLGRQALLVVSPEEAYRNRAALIATREGKRASWQTLRDLGAEGPGAGAAVGLQLAGRRLGVSLAPSAIPTIAATAILAPVALAAYRAWRRTEVATLVISTDEAEQLTWPRGDPTRYELYVGSPAEATTYYPAATFHEDVLFERYGELRELLSRLGATSIHARAMRGRGFDGSLGGEAPLPDGAGTVSASAAAQRSHLTAREDIRELAPSEPAPQQRLAEGLAWFAREKDWQRLADKCYEGRALRERLYLRQSNDFGLNANFEAAVKGLPVSVSIGGDYRKHVDTVWEIEATFTTRGAS